MSNKSNEIASMVGLSVTLVVSIVFFLAQLGAYGYLS